MDERLKKMSNKKSIKINYLLNTSYQILILFVPLITAPYLSRVLGVKNIGMYSYAVSIVSYFTLFAIMGTSTYGQRKIAYVQEDREERSRVFFETLIFRSIASITVLIFWFLFIWKNHTDEFIYMVLSLNIVSVLTDITWFFQGLEEFAKIIIRNLFIRVISILFVFICIKSSDDLVLYVAGTGVLNILGNISIWLYLPKYITKINSIKPFKDIKEIVLLFIPTIAIQIYTVLDKTMIGLFSDDSTNNGYYEQAEKIVKITLTVITSLGTVMIPRIAKTYMVGDKETVKQYLYRSYRFVWLLAIPMCLGFISIANRFVPIFYGTGYEGTIPLLKIFSLLLIIIGLSNVTGVQFLIPTKKQNIFTRTVIYGAAINLILNLIFIPKYYAIGAAIGSIIAELAITIIQFIYIYRLREFKIKNIFTGLSHYLVSGGIMCIIITLIDHYLAYNIYSLFIIIAVGILSYFGILFIMQDELIMEGLKDLKKLRNKLYKSE